jgi:hypothetical protein
VRRHAAAPELDADLQTVPEAEAPPGVPRHKITIIPGMPWQEGPDLPDPKADDDCGRCLSGAQPALA